MRFRSNRARKGRRLALSALLGYLVAWAAVGAAVALGVTWLIRGEESVSLPPVHETRLTTAATIAGCVLRHGPDGRPGVPVDGRTGRPATAGVYDEPPAESALIGALRRGIIVIHHRPELPSEHVDELRMVQEALPQGTIVTANAEMPDQVSATGWRRLLACDSVEDGTLDAVRLFHGRYVGRGPDASG